MSFSGKVKEELLEHYARARHCDIAELSAIVHIAGEFKADTEVYAALRCIRKILELRENALHYWKKRLI